MTPSLRSTQASDPEAGLGLRERKKRKTRLAISQVATALFIERGFDDVTVAEVAAAAEVSVNTVFNYFSTKEELFFDRAEEFELALANTLKHRRPDESPLDVLERAVIMTYAPVRPCYTSTIDTGCRAEPAANEEPPPG